MTINSSSMMMISIIDTQGCGGHGRSWGAYHRRTSEVTRGAHGAQKVLQQCATI